MSRATMYAATVIRPEVKVDGPSVGVAEDDVKGIIRLSIVAPCRGEARAYFGALDARKLAASLIQAARVAEDSWK